jgi:hypothetical protein
MSTVRLEDGRQNEEHIWQLMPSNGIRRHFGGQMDPIFAPRDVSRNDTVRPISKGHPKDVAFNLEQAAQD